MGVPRRAKSVPRKAMEAHRTHALRGGFNTGEMRPFRLRPADDLSAAALASKPRANRHGKAD